MPSDIVFTINPTNVLTRFPCAICGGCTDKEELICEAEGVGVACLSCITHPEDIDTCLRAHAEELEERAGCIRQRIGRIKLPTRAEWDAAQEALRAQYADVQRKYFNERLAEFRRALQDGEHQEYIDVLKQDLRTAWTNLIVTVMGQRSLLIG